MITSTPSDDQSVKTLDSTAFAQNISDKDNEASNAATSNNNNSPAGKVAESSKATHTDSQNNAVKEEPSDDSSFNTNNDTVLNAKDNNKNSDNSSIKQGTASKKHNNNNLEDTLDMRIIYILLFLVVLAFALMYVYIKRQHVKNEEELNSLKQKYSKVLVMYDDVKKEVDSLESNFNKKSAEKDAEILRLKETLAGKDSEKQNIDALKADYDKQLHEKEAEIKRLKEAVSEKSGEKQELDKLKADYNKQISEKESEISHLKEVLSEKDGEGRNLETLKKEYEKQIDEKNSEIERLKEVLSSYQDNVNPDVWNTEQSLLQHETVQQLHRDVDGAHAASDSQWDDLKAVVSKLMPDFYNELSSKNATLSENEFIVCILTRVKFLPTEMGVLLNLSKQRITNIRAAVNQKLFDERGTKTFENNIHNMGK